MNTFVSELQRRKLEYVLLGNTFKKIVPMNTYAFADMVQTIVSNNLRVYIDPDCDPDGYFSGLVVKRMFDYIGYTNYVVGKHDVKRHVIRQSFIANLLQQDFDAYILVDSSSNNMELINRVSSSGKLLAIIDHHETEYRHYDYPQGVVIINPKLDAKERSVVYDKLSAGAICALVCDYVLTTRYEHTSNHELYIYGFITLYSDICDLSNPYNLAYIRRFQNLELLGSDMLQMFRNEWTHFDRSFVSWRLVPRLNALFRTERFDMLHQLFYEFESIDNPYSYCEEIDEIYQDCRQYIQDLVPRCIVTQHKNFALVMLPEGVERKAHNFTGQVANHFASELNQTVLCLYSGSPSKYNGSVRDPFSRNILDIFQPLCYAQGHGAAFGVEIDKMMLPSIISTLNALEDLFVEEQQNVMLINWDGRTKSDVLQEQRVMAEYNEFGGQGLPKALGVVTVKPSWRIYRSTKLINVYGDGMKFTCFIPTIQPGDVMLVSPTLNGSDIKLMVNNVSYSDKL